jgi:hypothetical protein
VVWLRETIATEISKFKQALIYGNDATIAMSELAKLVNIFKHSSTYLHLLQTEY